MESAKVYPLNRNRVAGSGAIQVPPISSKPKLLDQVHQAIRKRHYRPKTEKSYVHWIKRFIFFHNKRHPAEMGEEEIGQFFSGLATDRHVSASTQNQALNAILFLYREVLRKKIGYVDGVIRAKRPHRLPVVLTRQEVTSILGALDHSDWLMVMLLYGAGLRLMECLQLRVKDIDFISNQIVVRAGKGDKDRHTMLPAAMKEPLARHLEIIREQHRRDSNGAWAESLCQMPWSANTLTPVKSGDGSGYFPQLAITQIGNRRKAQTPSARIGFTEGRETSRSKAGISKPATPAHVSPFFCNSLA